MMVRREIRRLRAELPRKIRRSMAEHVAYKGAALFIAVVLWFMIAGEKPSEEKMDVQLSLQLDTTLVRVSQLPPVTAQVIGQTRELLKLFSQPPELTRQYDSDTPDSVLVTLAPEDVSIPPGVDALVRDVAPRSFWIHFDTLGQKEVPVRSALQLSAAEGVRITGAPRFDPAIIMVYGRRQQVLRVEQIFTVERSLVVEDSLPITVQLAPPAGMRLGAESVSMTIPIVRQGTPP